jgi:hypothetical protein
MTEWTVPAVVKSVVDGDTIKLRTSAARDDRVASLSYDRLHVGVCTLVDVAASTRLHEVFELEGSRCA